MATLTYEDRIGSIVFNRLDCLRNEYAKNDCTLCQEVCAHDAFGFREGKLRLLPSCVQCGACVGVCPTHALRLEGATIETLVERLISSESRSFTCKDLFPCFGALNFWDWAVLVLEAKEVVCDVSHCASCNHNRENAVEKYLSKAIDEVNRLMQVLGQEARIRCEVHPNVKPAKRVWFEKLITPKSTMPSPDSLWVFKQKMKAYLERAVWVRSEDFSFIHPKAVTITCDNCKECVRFCPTHALSYDTTQTKILFQTGQCIGCNICETVCAKKAIDTPEATVDIASFAFERAEVLIAHDLRICDTCRCAFSYKGGEMICERCASFEKEHAEMFVLASQSR